jgi:DNA invertase Pin-like site-specific DNA recombinase
MNPNDAILYERFSPRPKAKEAECESIDQQHDRLVAYCTMTGLTPSHVIQDPATTAAIPLSERREGKRLEALLGRSGGHVVAQRLDRLFRDAADCLSTVARWDKRGVKLHLADQGGCSLDTSTAMGRLMLTNLAGVAEFERRLIADRTSEAMLRHQKNGKLMGSVAPYGWKRDMEDATRIVTDAAEQVVIEKMLQLRFDEMSYEAIARELDRQGVKPRSGAKWDQRAVNRVIQRAEGQQV